MYFSWCTTRVLITWLYFIIKVREFWSPDINHVIHCYKNDIIAVLWIIFFKTRLWMPMHSNSNEGVNCSEFSSISSCKWHKNICMYISWKKTLIVFPMYKSNLILSRKAFLERRLLGLMWWSLSWSPWKVVKTQSLS